MSVVHLKYKGKFRQLLNRLDNSVIRRVERNSHNDGTMVLSGASDDDRDNSVI